MVRSLYSNFPIHSPWLGGGISRKTRSVLAMTRATLSKIAISHQDIFPKTSSEIRKTQNEANVSRCADND
jgi:hypothetical protein